MDDVPFFILDLDGTLVDSAPDIRRALNAALAEAGLPPLSLAEVTARIGDGAAKLVERAVPPEAAAADVPALLARFREHYSEAVCVDSRVYPGVPLTLATMAERGARLTVLTNKPGDLARRLLETLGLAASIADLVGDGDGFPRKPAPDAARALLARAGLAAGGARAWVVGDGVPDVRLGHALGCPVAAAAWGYTPRAILEAEGPTRILERPEDLLALLAP